MSFSSSAARQRSPSQSSLGGGGTAKMWNFGSSIRRKASVSARDNKNADDCPDPTKATTSSSSLLPSSPDLPVVVSAHNDSNHRQLREYIQRMRAAPTNPAHVDAAFKEYAKIREQCAALVRALLSPPPQPQQQGTGHKRARQSVNKLDRPGSVYAQIGTVPWAAPSAAESRESVASTSSGGQRGSATDTFCGPDGNGTCAGSSGTTGRVNGAYLSAVRDWKDCLEHLAELHRTALERDPWPDIGDALPGDRDRRFSVQVPALRDKSEARLRNYAAVQKELASMSSLLQAGESGISLDRVIREEVIAPRGDAILEFANVETEWKPVLRFRVSSHMLAETSPVFARMFLLTDGDGGGGGGGGQQQQQTNSWEELDLYHLDMDEDVSAELPPRVPARFVYADGSTAKLYRMPQLELNNHSALSVLLHAAHHHNDHVPRDISFEQFVAVAEVALRYRCTAPLEVFVEHRWLPQWMHKATEEMPDGLLLISYAFGIRRLFTRMTKTIIMNVVSEKDIYEKSWPRPIKDSIRAICSAKRAQIYQACLDAVGEFLRPPPPPLVFTGGSEDGEHSDDGLSTEEGNSNNGRDSLTSTLGGLRHSPSQPTTLYPSFAVPSAIGPLILHNTPRCPKGSHWCDATNLGWFLLVLNELHLLGPVMSPSALASHPPPPPHSLAQLIEVLRQVPSPPHPVHAAQRVGGVCDPASAFRAEINDVYNSVSGLTLFDVSGRRHGWALSRHKRDLPQAVLRARRSATGRRGLGQLLDEGVCLRLLRGCDTVEDVRSLGCVSRAFYETFKKHKVELVMDLIIREGEGGEEKVRKGEADLLRDKGDKGEELDGVDESAGGHEDDESDEDDDDTEILESEFTMVKPSEANGKMTEEEARRILWPSPDPDPPPSFSAAAIVPAVVGEGCREKFRADDVVFIEEKNLVIADNKQLREERDRRVGLIRAEPG